MPEQGESRIDEIRRKLATVENNEGYRVLCALVAERLDAANHQLARCEASELVAAQAKVLAWDEIASILNVPAGGGTGGLVAMLGEARHREPKREYPRVRF